MNTNRQNNNRRRGRGNNNRQQNNNRNGFDYQNQIDNRARGNAAQMLEKYKKLAQDAQFNGDRVNAEYHLQFADHYFRVLADFRSRQEARQDQQGERRNRDEWRDQNGDSGFEEMEAVETGDSENEVAADESDDRPRRESREDRPRRSDRNERGNRDRDGNRAPRRHHSEEQDDEPAGLDLAVLPPSIALANDDDGNIEVVAEEVAPKRKPRARRPKSANDEEMVTAAE
ncbi:MAG: DUF4167 domain-containing protein [Sphingomonadaceae bacterium]|nr:DUF4167 domain-containing protein [Sphingomonadaceae bacterium]